MYRVFVSILLVSSVQSAPINNSLKFQLPRSFENANDALIITGNLRHDRTSFTFSMAKGTEKGDLDDKNVLCRVTMNFADDTTHSQSYEDGEPLTPNNESEANDLISGTSTFHIKYKVDSNGLIELKINNNTLMCSGTKDDFKFVVFEGDIERIHDLRYVLG